MNKYFEKYPEKKKSHNKCSKIFPKTKGNVLHHWSYNEEHSKDIIELTKEQHYLIHRFLCYDKLTFMYKIKDTDILLNTKELHLEFINKILSNN